MRHATTATPRTSSRDPQHFRHLYAHTWKPGCERMRWIMRLLAERDIPFEVEGFMADSEAWSNERPAVRHLPDLRVLAS